MPEVTQLLSKEREQELQRAREARELQETQQRWAMLADDYHQQIRKAAADIGRKKIAEDLGVDLSTVSNWLSCEVGRGYPPPRLLLYLRANSTDLGSWEADHAVVVISDDQVINELVRGLLPELGKRDAEKMLSILRRRKGSR